MVSPPLFLFTLRIVADRNGGGGKNDCVDGSGSNADAEDVDCGCDCVGLEGSVGGAWFSFTLCLLACERNGGGPFAIAFAIDDTLPLGGGGGGPLSSKLLILYMFKISYLRFRCTT